VEEEEGQESIHQGADFDALNGVTTADLDSFMDHWNAGEPAADVNRDDTVDAQDVLEFLDLYAG